MKINGISSPEIVIKKIGAFIALKNKGLQNCGRRLSDTKALLEVSVTTDWFPMPIRSILLHNALIVRTQASDKMHFAPRISDIFFWGGDWWIDFMFLFFLVCGSTFTFVFVFQWATTVLGIIEKVELDRNALHLHLLPFHAQCQYLSLSVWHGSWIVALHPQKMQHQERLQQQKTTHQRSPLLLQVLPSFNYSGGHLIQDQDHHLLLAKNLKEDHLLWHLLQDVSHSSGQEHLDSLLRFKKQQWQLSLPSLQQH